MNKITGAIFYLLFSVILLSCSEPEVIRDLSDTSVQLINQDSSEVVFPDAYNGKITVVGFIYTNCPDVCPMITTNMSKINRQLDNNSDVHFVGISFDPNRDTPPVLRDYMEQFELDDQQFSFLTGDSVAVDSVLEDMGILAQISYRKTTKDGRNLYFMNHTNRITLMDGKGRIRGEYSGSYTKPEQIINDINRLR